jgi:NADH-quinone oxidoreductase subunit N
LTLVGAFGVVAAVERRAGGARLSDFGGLSRREPVLSACMLVFLLSLAGIPPLAGFFGKFYVFASALRGGPEGLGLLWLVVLALAMSAVSLYYYLQVLKQIYIVEEPPAAAPGSVSRLIKGSMVLLALGVLVLGCVPDLLLVPLARAMRLTG